MLARAPSMLLAAGGGRGRGPAAGSARAGRSSPQAVDLRDPTSRAERDRARRAVRAAAAGARAGARRGRAGGAAALARAPAGGAPSARRDRWPRRRARGRGARARAVAAAAAAARRSRAGGRLRVGLVTQSWRGWAADLVKATAIEAGARRRRCAAVVGRGEALSRAAGGLPAAARIGARRRAAGGARAGGARPLFNDFTPLPEGQTRSDVLELAAAAGVSVGEVYSVDASRRTTAANAYVTGLGPTKRVVLFDTLLDRYSRDEMRHRRRARARPRPPPGRPRSGSYAAIVAPAGALRRAAAELGPVARARARPRRCRRSPWPRHSSSAADRPAREPALARGRAPCRCLLA